ncbi:hypothetical protein ACX1IQ_21150 [Yersinia enterocolitica]
MKTTLLLITLALSNPVLANTEENTNKVLFTTCKLIIDDSTNGTRLKSVVKLSTAGSTYGNGTISHYTWNNGTTTLTVKENGKAILYSNDGTTRANGKGTCK